MELEFTEPGWIPREERRTAPASDISRIGIGTTIGGVQYSSKPRWAKYNQRLQHDQQTLRHGLKELRALAAALEATDAITDQSAHLFRRAADEELLVGQSIEAVAAGCLHATARQNGVPYPLKQVADVSPVEAASIRTAFSKLVREFSLKVAPPMPAAFIPRFASSVGLSYKIRRLAFQFVADLVNDEQHIGQSPTGVAAASLYGAAKVCGESVTQERLASIAFVSVVTLSRQWQMVKQYVDEAEY